MESSSNLFYSLTINIIAYSYQCAGQFQVTEVDQSHGIHEEWGISDSAECAGECDGKGVDEGITSPASYVVCFVFVKC